MRFLWRVSRCASVECTDLNQCNFFDIIAISLYDLIMRNIYIKCDIFYIYIIRFINFIRMTIDVGIISDKFYIYKKRYIYYKYIIEDNF